MIPPPTGWPKTGRYHDKHSVGTATVSPPVVVETCDGETPQVGG